MVVLATPPFWFAKAITLARGGLDCVSALGRGARRIPRCVGELASQSVGLAARLGCGSRLTRLPSDCLGLGLPRAVSRGSSAAQWATAVGRLGTAGVDLCELVDIGCGYFAADGLDFVLAAEKSHCAAIRMRAGFSCRLGNC